MIGILLGIGALISAIAFACLLAQPYAERERAQIRRLGLDRPQQSLSPMELYLSSGKVPEGRTAEILFEAERGYQRRNEIRDEIRRQVSDSPSPSEDRRS
jgi:hypothetical protein